MKKAWCKWFPLVFSGIALLLSICACFKSWAADNKIDAYGLFGTAMTILVTILIGWQISSVVNFNDERRKWEGIIKNQSTKITQLENDLKNNIAKVDKSIRDNLIALSSVIVVSSNPDRFMRVTKWLNIINDCRCKNEAEDSMDIAATFIASEFNKINHNNSSFDVIECV